MIEFWKWAGEHYILFSLLAITLLEVAYKHAVDVMREGLEQLRESMRYSDPGAQLILIKADRILKGGSE